MASENKLKDYSQEGEQQVILKYFGNRKGSFLDIGAYDGIMCSNTHALALSGWDGVCVEPNPGVFARLMDNYKDNHHIALLNAFIGFERVITQFYSADLVSTNNYEHLAQFNVKSSQRIYVPVIPIEDIASYFSKEYNFISIDVEGNSVELFKKILPIYKPEMICVEHEHQKDECATFAAQHGYTSLFVNGINIIFVKGR